MYFSLKQFLGILNKDCPNVCLVTHFPIRSQSVVWLDCDIFFHPCIFRKFAFLLVKFQWLIGDTLVLFVSPLICIRLDLNDHGGIHRLCEYLFLFQIAIFTFSLNWRLICNIWFDYKFLCLLLYSFYWFLCYFLWGMLLYLLLWRC